MVLGSYIKIYIQVHNPLNPLVVTTGTSFVANEYYPKLPPCTITVNMELSSRRTTRELADDIVLICRGKYEDSLCDTI